MTLDVLRTGDSTETTDISKILFTEQADQNLQMYE